MTITFSIKGTPVAKGRPRFSMRGKYPIAYTPTKTRNAEDDIKLFAAQAFRGHPLSGPLSIKVRFFMPMPDSWSNKKKAELGGEPHVSRPDLDNLVKTVADAINGIAYGDDSQIYKIEAEKFYAIVGMTAVTIEQHSPCVAQ